jgi:protease-4
MKTMYGGFVRAVAKNRDMTEEQVEAVAQGRVWTGLAAKENGLIDRIGGLEDAVMIARELAGISPDDQVDVQEYGPRGLVRWNAPAPALSSAFPGGAMGTLMARWLLGGDDTTQAGNDATYLDDYGFLYLRRLVQNNGRGQFLLPPDAIPQDGSQGGE